MRHIPKFQPSRAVMLPGADGCYRAAQTAHASDSTEAAKQTFGKGARISTISTRNVVSMIRPPTRRR